MIWPAETRVGDLVHVIADNCDCGTGLVVEVIHEHLADSAYRILTSDGRCLYYHPWEVFLIQPIEAECEMLVL